MKKVWLFKIHPRKILEIDPPFYEANDTQLQLFWSITLHGQNALLLWFAVFAGSPFIVFHLIILESFQNMPMMRFHQVLPLLEQGG